MSWLCGYVLSRGRGHEASFAEMSGDCGLVAAGLAQECFQLNSTKTRLCKPCALGAVRAMTAGAGAAPNTHPRQHTHT